MKIVHPRHNRSLCLYFVWYAFVTRCHLEVVEISHISVYFVKNRRNEQKQPIFVGYTVVKNLPKFYDASSSNAERFFVSIVGVH